MSLTLFSTTFCSSTRVKWGISRWNNDTALPRGHSSSYRNSILSLALQHTLTKTPVRHFSITYEATTNTFMLDTNHRNTPQPFSWPYTSINLRYGTIYKSQDGVVIRVTERLCFNDNKMMYSYHKNIVQTGTQLSFNTKNMHSFGDVE
jgi:hypothetical protein